ncbi:MAG: glycosyltransferase [Bryobacteraceae bacterium]
MKVQFFYVEAGGGHKSAATALKTVIEKQKRGWDVELVNMNDVLGATDVMKRLTGKSGEDYYNLMLKKGWTFLAPWLMPPMHALIAALRPRHVKLLAEFWRRDPPDIVVSVMPHFNRTMFLALREVSSTIPFVTIITDFADIPPRVWLERQEQYVICGTDLAVQQATIYGHPPDRVFRVSGMILRPSFYEIQPIDRPLERAAYGLQPDLATALVLFGGEGSKAMIGIAERLGRSGLPLQMILMYGRNEKLGAKLRALELPVPVHVRGFTSDVPKFMQMADFMIGKPGPGSISEAMALELPVIVDCNASTMPQERYNAQWLLEKKVGLVVSDWGEIVGAVRSLLEPNRLGQFRERAAAIDNRAVFEIPDILAGIAARHAA